MSTTESIESLFKQGVVEVKILAPGPNNPLCVQAMQAVNTGGKNRSNIVHQIEENTLGGCLESLREQVDRAHQLKSNVMRLPRN